MRSIDSRAVYMRKYNRTLVGFIKTKWAKMVQRVRGHNGHNHLYEGLTICDKESFYAWALSDKNLIDMFDAYRLSEWDLDLCPSIDRIKPENGYVIGNMRFITMKENRDAGRESSRHVRTRTYKQKWRNNPPCAGGL